MTGWARRPAPVLGVVGPRTLTERLAPVVAVNRLLPTSARVEDVDAVVLARSAVMAGGSWAGALRPVGFDRGVGLARLLRRARTAGVPVVLLDDAHAGEVDGWHTMLDGAVDEGLVLGPAVLGAVGWHPGRHWDPVAARTAATRPAGHADAPPTPVSGGWRQVQRVAAATGHAVVTGDDPWQQHLAGELATLGVDVRDGDGASVTGTDDRTPPWVAVARLCAALDVAAPRRRAVALRHPDQPSEGLDDRLARLGMDLLGAGPADVVVHGDPDGEPDAMGAAITTCVTALDRLGHGPGHVVRCGRTVAAVGPDPQPDHGTLLRIAVDVGGLA